MRKLLIALLTAILAALGGSGYYVAEQLGQSNVYLSSAPIQATTTVQGCKESLVTSTTTDAIPMPFANDIDWECATTSDGNVPLLVGENTRRANLEICVVEDAPAGIRFWLANATNTTMMASSTNSDGIEVRAGVCWNMADYGVIWPGRVFALTSTTEAVAITGTGTTTVRYTDFSQQP